MADVSEQLERLANLLREGLITRSEFDQQKQALLTAPASPQGSSPNLNEAVGAYKILGELGEGGMGVVYKARHRMEVKANQQGGDVAVKVLHAQYAQNTEYRERFEREASLGMKLNHPGIIRVFDLIQDSGSLAIAMEMAEGRPMSQMIGHETGPIPWDKAWPLFEQILTAVEYAHSQGVVHRDIKPENVVVGTNGSLKILDFGIAKDLEDGKTKTGTGMGTVDYMAPEQYTDASKVDQRADIYALGMTLYEMLAGRLPWAASTTEFKVLTLKSQGDFPPPTDFYPEIPEGVLRALDGALAVELGDRFTDVGAFRRALEGVVLEAPVVTVQAPKAEAVPESEAAIEPTDPGVVSSSAAPKNPIWTILKLIILALIIISIFAAAGDWLGS
jgi:serine/threonine protein kinase